MSVRAHSILLESCSSVFVCVTVRGGEMSLRTGGKGLSGGARSPGRVSAGVVKALLNFRGAKC